MTTRRLVDILYGLQRTAWRLFRPRTRGVKVMLFNSSGALVLIRNSYGNTSHFVLPGGGIRPFEQPNEAARREIREELGVTVVKLEFRSLHANSSQGKRDTIYLFNGLVEGTLEVDQFEVAEARFADLQQIPPETSPATRRRIEEYLGIRETNGQW